MKLEYFPFDLAKKFGRMGTSTVFLFVLLSRNVSNRQTELPLKIFCRGIA